MSLNNCQKISNNPCQHITVRNITVATLLEQSRLLQNTQYPIHPSRTNKNVDIKFTAPDAFLE